MRGAVPGMEGVGQLAVDGRPFCKGGLNMRPPCESHVNLKAGMLCSMRARRFRLCLGNGEGQTQGLVMQSYTMR